MVTLAQETAWARSLPAASVLESAGLRFTNLGQHMRTHYPLLNPLLKRTLSTPRLEPLQHKDVQHR
eukprot:1841566-Amphidinium_carterae.1